MVLGKEKEVGVQKTGAKVMKKGRLNQVEEREAQQAH